MRTPYRSFSNLIPMVRSGVRAHKWVKAEILAEAPPPDRMFMSQSANFVSKMYYYTYREW